MQPGGSTHTPATGRSLLSREYVEQMVGVVPGGHADVLAKAVFLQQVSEVCIDGGGIRTGAVDVPRQQQSVGVCWRWYLRTARPTARRGRRISSRPQVGRRQRL